MIHTLSHDLLAICSRTPADTIYSHLDGKEVGSVENGSPYGDGHIP